eukprot:946555-Pelagomonas_calceolata.AAC.6
MAFLSVFRTGCSTIGLVCGGFGRKDSWAKQIASVFASPSDLQRMFRQHQQLPCQPLTLALTLQSKNLQVQVAVSAAAILAPDQRHREGYVNGKHTAVPISC